MPITLFACNKEKDVIPNYRGVKIDGSSEEVFNKLKKKGLDVGNINTIEIDSSHEIRGCGCINIYKGVNLFNDKDNVSELLIYTGIEDNNVYEIEIKQESNNEEQIKKYIEKFGNYTENIDYIGDDVILSYRWTKDNFTIVCCYYHTFCNWENDECHWTFRNDRNFAINRLHF